MDDTLRQKMLDQVLSTIDLCRPKQPHEFNKDDLIARAASSNTTLTVKKVRDILSDLISSGQVTWRWAKVSSTGREKVYTWVEPSTDSKDSV